MGQPSVLRVSSPRAGWATVLAMLACSHTEVPRTVVAPPPSSRPVRRFRAPRMTCEAPLFPEMRNAWTVVGWPTTPRFSSVDAEGALLYATTTSTVCRSLDGGRTWEPLLIDLDAPVLAAVDGGRVVIRAEESWEGRDDADAVWWVTDNGGTNWAHHDRPPEVGQGRIARIAVHAHELEGEYAAVSCGDALYTVVPAPRGRAPAALRSEDGGLTWTRMSVPTQLREQGTTFRCIGHDSVALERGGAIPLVTAFSRDRGEHWEAVVRLPQSMRTPNTDAVSGDEDLPSSGCAPLAGRGVFCEVQGQSWASADRGRRWHRANSPVGGRTLPMHGEFLLGVGGGVARSTDAGQRWEIVTVAPGRANLGMRGGVLTPQSYWLAGTAIWWTDDGGEHWTASQLPWELVSVIARERWVGLRPVENAPDGCGASVMLTVNGGRQWRPVLGPRVRRVEARGDGELRAYLCGTVPRVYTSRDGLRWRLVTGRAPIEPEADDASEGAVTTDGIRVELSGGELRAVRQGAQPEVIASTWPRDITPVGAASAGGNLSVVLFGNGTVLRRP